MTTNDSLDNTIPALRRVHVVNHNLRGTYIHARDGRRQRQARFIEAYNQAVRPDGRVLLKEGGSGTLIGPLLEFLKLRPDEAGASEKVERFTRTYGPLIWHGRYTRLAARDVRTGERRRGLTHRIVDRSIWTLPLSEFWLAQRQFRATIELATAAQNAPERLPQLVRQALDVLPEVRQAFGDELGVTDPETLRANALGYLDEYERSTPSDLRRHALAIRVGELVGDLVTRKTPSPRIMFDSVQGFQQRPQFGGVLDVIYFLAVAELPAFRFCANCEAVYFTHRPDKKTCGQRCASLLGKREWARKNYRQRSRKGRKRS